MKQVFFEYHCYEGHDSADAQLWYRSHQKVTVLKQTEKGAGKTKLERANNGQPAVYRVRFADGYIAEAIEDELMDSRKGFFRPNPPKNKGAK